jgi:tyrosine-protein kinase
MIDSPDGRGTSEPAGIEIAEHLRALRRRWRLILLTVLVATGTAVGVSLSSEKKYDASAELLFRQDEGTSAQDVGAPRPTSSDREREITTEAALIKLDSIAERVRRRLALTLSNAKVLDLVKTETERGSDLVKITVRDGSAVRATRIANAFANEFVDFRTTLARKNLERAATLARTQYDALIPTEQQTPEGRALLARERELRIDAALQTGGVQIVRRAAVPRDPSRPRPKLSGAIGALLGLLLGVAAAVALEIADRRLKDEESIERAFGLPVLSLIPRPLRRGGRTTGDDPRMREAFGMLGANVRYSSAEHDPQVLLVTSPSPAEGKTSVTLGLARALARFGLRVIAIEADLRRPAFARYTTLSESNGLISVVAGTSRLSQELVWVDAATMTPVTVDAAKDGVSVALLPAGAVPPHPERLLSRPAMADVVAVARSLADVVLIDTPPVATVNDAVTLSRIVDEAILVARLGKTTKDAARRAMRVLRNLDIKLAGVVVTDTDPAGPDYGYYGGEPSREDAPPAGGRSASRSTTTA